VDVQHLYRVGLHARDRGTRFRLANGTTVWEADAATHYAQALTQELRDRGAFVLTNDPVRKWLTGYYSARNRQATAWGAKLYLACHLNAGGGSCSRVEVMRARPAGTATAAIQLAGWIHGALGALPQIRLGHTVVLNHGERGAVCIEGVGPWIPALLLEPFFGDTPKMQDLLGGAELATVGKLIGQGVAAWWRATRAPT
jgi:N-acetylmuramoyl-L-alanine amidase